MEEAKKGNYNFVFVIAILVILVLFAVVIYMFPTYNAKVILALELNESRNISNNTDYYPYNSNISVVDDPLFGRVYSFLGRDYLKTKHNVNATHGFSVSAFAYVDDNTNRNNLGIVSTSYQRSDTGFRLKYRDFEDEVRIYVQVGNETLYGSIPNGACYRSWCHYAFTYNSDNGKVVIYGNGVRLGSHFTNPNVMLNNKINIGNTIDINQEFFRGKIINVSVYDGILADSEVKEIAKALKGNTPQ